MPAARTALLTLALAACPGRPGTTTGDPGGASSSTAHDASSGDTTNLPTTTADPTTSGHGGAATSLASTSSDAATTSTATTNSPSTSTDATTASSGASDSAPTFDHGGPPAACDILGDDCPEGQKCGPVPEGEDVFNWTVVACVPLAPDPRQPGEACAVEGFAGSGLDDCAAHAVCWGVDEQLAGTCVPMCQGDATCPDGTACMPADVVDLCLAPCDPLASDCPPGHMCTDPANSGFFCMVDISGDAGQLADDCSALNDCDPGLACYGSFLIPGCSGDAIGCCTPWCDLDDPQCPPNFQCNEVAPPVGICTAA